MKIDYPRNWHAGRSLLLVTWLFVTTSYGALFVGATYEGEGFRPSHLLLALLATQAVLIAAALLSHYRLSSSLFSLVREKPRAVMAVSVIFQAAALVVLALTMREWNDELHNIDQAKYLAAHGLRDWLANYESLNRWLGPHHPPLLALLYGGFYALVGPHLIAGRLFNIAFSLAALLVGLRLVRRLTDEPTAALASLCWLLFPLWLFNGAAAIMEGPFLLLFLLTAYVFLSFWREGKTSQAVGVGFLLTLSMLCRYNIALLVPGMFVALLLPDRRHLLGKPGTYWILGVPLLLLAPLAGLAAGSGLLFAQAAHLSWAALLLRPGGVFYLVETLLPLWPLHFGAHLLPLFLLGLAVMFRGNTPNRLLLALGGSYLLLVLLILPNPRYLLPAVPFVAAGMARVLALVEDRSGAAAAVWLGTFGAALVLIALVVAGSNLGDFYPFY